MDKCHAFILKYIGLIENELIENDSVNYKEIIGQRFFVRGLIDWLFHAKDMQIDAYSGYTNLERALYSSYPDWFEGLEYMYEDEDDLELDDEDCIDDEDE